MSMLENYRRKLRRARKVSRSSVDGRVMKRVRVKDPDLSKKKK